jgi:GH24 family phage-related lysozyme (muramidase)
MWGLIPDRLKYYNNDKFTKKLFEHLKLREGYKQSVYLDILGKPTCGIGHLLTKEENKKYPVKSLVPKRVIDNWFKEDVKTALDASKTQMKLLKLNDDDFKIALVSVNYQLGTSWHKKFPATWKLLKAKHYDDAIKELLYKNPPEMEPSTWKEQTPVRVEDFVEAINKLKGDV